MHDNIPMTISAVANGMPTRWVWAEYGKLLNAYGIRNGVNVTFNLSSPEDIEHKIHMMEDMKNKGLINSDDLDELKERIRMSSNFIIGGNGDQSKVAIGEDTDTPWLYTDEAKARRRKTIDEKRTDKALGILDENKKKRR